MGVLKKKSSPAKKDDQTEKQHTKAILNIPVGLLILSVDTQIIKQALVIIFSSIKKVKNSNLSLGKRLEDFTIKTGK